MFTKPFSMVRRHFRFPGSGKFIVSEHFKEGFRSVNIGYLGQNFRNNFSGTIIEPLAGGPYEGSVLSKTMLGMEILDTFDGRVFVPLPVLWHLLLKQPDVLLKGGKTTIVIPPNSKYAIGAFLFERGWSIKAYPLDSERPWFSGNQILLISF